ncbi:hypothetical protein PBPMD00_31 [Pinkberry virus LS07-2018-MD00]|nr:hypothetical protein PBPMD00_31 [Pinkberry virus LS07-2018-MD00]
MPNNFTSNRRAGLGCRMNITSNRRAGRGIS